MKNLNIAGVADDIRSTVSARPELIKQIGIFGSLARGDHGSNSDIDLLVEYNAAPSFDMESFTDYCEMCGQIRERLSGTYSREVDIVHIESWAPDEFLMQAIGGEVVWL